MKFVREERIVTDTAVATVIADDFWGFDEGGILS